MAVKTVSNAGGVWNVTTTWTDNIVPVAGDTVVFTATSGDLTLNVPTANLAGIDFTNYVGTITFTNAINTSGTVNLGTGGYTQAGASGLVINGTSTISGSATWSRTLTFTGTSITYTLGNNLNVTGNISLSGATTSVFNGNILNIGGNLTVTTLAIVSGTTAFVFNGTGTWNHTASGGYIQNNVTINTAGTLTLGTNIYYQTGTLTYVQGTVSAGTSTLNIGTATTLDTGGMTWANVSISTNVTSVSITLSSALNTSGQLLLSGLTLSFSGGGLLNPSGSLYIKPFSINQTVTIPNNLTVTNLTLATATGNTGSTNTINGNSINITGNLTLTDFGVTSGTTTLNLTGTGSWTHQNTTTTLRNNLNINTSGTITISGNIYYNTGTITHLGGTVIASSSTLFINSTTIGLNTSGMTWGSVVGYYLGGASSCTITLGSQLNCANFFANYTDGGNNIANISINGSFGLNVTNTLYIGCGRRNTANSTSPNTSFTLTGASTTNNMVFYIGGTYVGGGTITINGSTLTVNGTVTSTNYTEYTNSITGTTEIILKGTLWNFNGLTTSAPFPNGVTQISTNLTLQPTTTLSFTTTASTYNSTLFWYASRTLKYVSGTVSTTLGLVATNATLNLGAFANWNDRDIYLSGTTTLQSDLNPNNLFTYSTAVALSGAFNINVKGNLSIGVATSGASTPIFLNGTGAQTYSHSAAVNLSNNLTINKASGTLTLGANIYYNTGTFTYITATSVNTSTNSTTLNIGGSCTLATNGISWVNLNTSVTATIALTNDLVWSNNWTVTAGTIAFSDTGNLAPALTANLLFSGTPIVTLKNNIQVTNASLAGTINTNQISISGNLTIVALTGGTTTLLINGTGSQSWTHSSAVYLGTPLTINKDSGTLTLGANVYYQGSLFTYTAGNVDVTTNSNTFVTNAGTYNTIGLVFNNFLFATNGGNVITLASDLYAGGTFTVGGAGTINGSFNVYSGILNINNSVSSATITTVTYNGGSFYCSGNCTFSGGAGTGQVITTNTVYVGGSMFFNATGNDQGPADLIMTGNGVVSQSLSSNRIYSNIFINTGGKITFSNTLYFTLTRNVTISLQRGNVDATKCILFLPRPSGTYNLINNHKINWKIVYLPSGGNVSMNEFFNGSAQVKTNVLPTSTTNYTITFTDNFEKISKFVKLNNCTLSRKNQLLMLTNITDKRTNIGVRFFNTLPNGVPENKPSISTQPMLSSTLVGDPAMIAN
jgi:hypothetical protein